MGERPRQTRYQEDEHKWPSTAFSLFSKWVVHSKHWIQLKNVHKSAWTHLRSKHQHMIDYCLTRRRDWQDVFYDQSYALNRLLNRPIITAKQTVMRVRPPNKKKLPNKKPICVALGTEKNKQLQESITARLSSSKAPSKEDDWKSLASVTSSAAEEVLGRLLRKNRDWFDTNQ